MRHSIGLAPNQFVRIRKGTKNAAMSYELWPKRNGIVTYATDSHILGQNGTEKEMKITFNEYCRLNPAIYNEAGEPIAWFFGSVVESVDTPDLKSVDRKGRGGSSPPTPT